MLAKSRNQADFQNYNTEWYKNADDITNFLTAANPNYYKKELNDMMYIHLKLITNGVVAKLNKDWNANITALDNNQEHLSICQISWLMELSSSSQISFNKGSFQTTIVTKKP